MESIIKASSSAGANGAGSVKKLKINATDLDLAIREGCNPMQQLLDPEHDNLPYFSNVMSGDDPHNGHHESFSLSHIPGRWLNALLNAEETLGVELDEHVISELQRWTYASYSHPMGLAQMLDLQTFQLVAIADFHNLRESMHALYALVKFRNDEKALELAKRQITMVNRYFNFETGDWDEVGFHRDTGGSTTCTCHRPHETRKFPISFGRYIGPLVKLYKATGLEEALVQAIRLKDYAFKNIINERGDYDVRVFGGHTHSTTAMISSLAQLGEVLNDDSILQRVQAFMDNGMKQITLEFGWCIENYYNSKADWRKDHYGEINNTSDIMETCLILGKAGHTRYLQVAERILRAHFLPSQLLDTSFLPDLDLPDEDSRHLLASRARGAFGFPCPYGHEFEPGGWISFNWDIVGGGVGGLCEAYRDKVTRVGTIISVNLHFDHEDDDIQVASPYTNGDVLGLTMKKSGSVRVRLSDWIDRSQLRIEVDESSSPVNSFFSGDWLYITDVAEQTYIQLHFPMKEQHQVYVFRSDLYTFLWRGDAVKAVAAPGKQLCFFDELPRDVGQ
jgi:hypothetical protein